MTRSNQLNMQSPPDTGDVGAIGVTATAAEAVLDPAPLLAFNEQL